MTLSTLPVRFNYAIIDSILKTMEVNKLKRRDDLLIGPREKAIAAVKAGKKEE